MRATISSFYDERYFSSKLTPFGDLQARANLFKFLPFIHPTDNLIDFGCGSGNLLAALNAKNKIGIEINPSAVAYGRSLGLSEIYADLDQVEDA